MGWYGGGARRQVPASPAPPASANARAHTSPHPRPTPGKAPPLGREADRGLTAVWPF